MMIIQVCMCSNLAIKNKKLEHLFPLNFFKLNLSDSLCDSGVSLGEGTGATMSDDEDDLQMDGSLDQSSAEGHDLMGFGPLLPTESERSLMERVRQELKIELKQVILKKSTINVHAVSASVS